MCRWGGGGYDVIFCAARDGDNSLKKSQFHFSCGGVGSGGVMYMVCDHGFMHVR